MLCRGLSEAVALLEKSGCSHRDLSSGNVFVDVDAWRVGLIDFDSLYHESLSFPASTTCGTAGYTAPFAWQGETLNSSATWCPYADRFALAMLSAEFLVMRRGAPLTAEGGIFEQDELRVRSGASLEFAIDGLKPSFPRALSLFEAAIQSRSYEDCPSPAGWRAFCDSAQDPLATPPRLEELEDVLPEYFEKLLKRQRPPAPLWPAPRLGEVAEVRLEPAGTTQRSIRLPPDPWRS